MGNVSRACGVWVRRETSRSWPSLSSLIFVVIPRPLVAVFLCLITSSHLPLVFFAFEHVSSSLSSRGGVSTPQNMQDRALSNLMFSPVMQ